MKSAHPTSHLVQTFFPKESGRCFLKGRMSSPLAGNPFPVEVFPPAGMFPSQEWKSGGFYHWFLFGLSNGMELLPLAHSTRAGGLQGQAGFKQGGEGLLVSSSFNLV